MDSFTPEDRESGTLSVGREIGWTLETIWTLQKGEKNLAPAWNRLLILWLFVQCFSV
jgi:hypothetical protein